MKKKIIFLFLLFYILTISISFAHKAECIEVEGSIVKFQFDTGDPMENANLDVLDKNSKSIFKTNIGKDGLFDYGKYFGEAKTLVANDGSGHLVEYKIPDKIPTKEEIEVLAKKRSDMKRKKLITRIFLIVVILITTFIFIKRRRNKNK